MITRLLVLASFVLVLATAGPARATPTTVPIAARIVTAGVPVDGPVAVRFQIYDQPALGTLLWEESELTLDAQAGFVAHALGATTPLTPAIFDGSVRYVQLRVNGVDMAQRLAVRAVPYAVRAGVADLAHSVGTLATPAGERLTVTDSGRVGLGVAAPVERLHVAGKIVADPTYGVAATSTPFITSSQTFVDIPGLAATVTTHGKPVLVTVSTNLDPTSPPLAMYGSWGAITITRDGGNLGHAVNGFQIASNARYDNVPVAFTFVDVPPAGPHTYRVQVRAGEAAVTVTMGEGGQTQQVAAIELH